MNLTEIERRLRVCWDKRAGEKSVSMAWLEGVAEERDEALARLEQAREALNQIAYEQAGPVVAQNIARLTLAALDG